MTFLKCYSFECLVFSMNDPIPSTGLPNYVIVQIEKSQNDGFASILRGMLIVRVLQEKVLYKKDNAKNSQSRKVAEQNFFFHAIPVFSPISASVLFLQETFEETFCSSFKDLQYGTELKNDVPQRKSLITAGITSKPEDFF